MDSEDLMIATVILGVLVHNSQRTRRKLTRSAILTVQDSPWRHVYTNGDESSFLELTGMTRQAFDHLESILFDIGREATPKRGRPSSLTNADKLGLYLFFVGSRMNLKHLCLIFGIVPTTASKVIDQMIDLVVDKLETHVDARVAFPDTPEEMERLAAITHQREPEVANCIGFIDGLAVPIQCSDSPAAQEKNYNGYYSDTVCNNVFLFSPEGKIMFCIINAPGSWHDSQVAFPLAALAIEAFGTYCACVDQGFARGGDLFEKFVGPVSKKTLKKISRELRPFVARKHNLYTSLRQASEWGMRALQGTFSRMKSRLTSNEIKRGKIILSIVLLHNFRTGHVGLNQIAEVFGRDYEPIINIEPYDRIKRYFCTEDDLDSDEEHA
jgi:hypothetical protein